MPELLCSFYSGAARGSCALLRPGARCIAGRDKKRAQRHRSGCQGKHFLSRYRIQNLRSFTQLKIESSGELQLQKLGHISQTLGTSFLSTPNPKRVACGQ